MKGIARDVIIFASGIAIGFGLGYISFKTYFEKKADNEIASCRDMYLEREREYNQAVLDNSINNPTVKPEEKRNGLESATTSLELEHPDIKTVDYTKNFKGKEDEMLKKTQDDLIAGAVKAQDCIEAAELESPEDDEELTDEEDDLQQEDYEMYLVNEEHRKAVAENRPPYQIPEEALGSVPGYETIDLFYYQLDHVLCDENHEELDVPEIFVGDLLETDWVNNDQETITIRSDIQMIDVQVHKNTTDKFYNE